MKPVKTLPVFLLLLCLTAVAHSRSLPDDAPPRVVFSENFEDRSWNDTLRPFSDFPQTQGGYLDNSLYSLDFVPGHDGGTAVRLLHSVGGGGSGYGFWGKLPAKVKHGKATFWARKGHTTYPGSLTYYMPMLLSEDFNWGAAGVQFYHTGISVEGGGLYHQEVVNPAMVDQWYKFEIEWYPDSTADYSIDGVKVLTRRIGYGLPTTGEYHPVSGLNNFIVYNSTSGISDMYIDDIEVVSFDKEPYATGRIAFMSSADRTSTYGDVWIVDDDGVSNPENLTRSQNTGYVKNLWPALSHDGKKVAYVSSTDGSRWNVHVMDLTAKDSTGNYPITVVPLNSTDHSIHRINWSQDDRFLLTARNTGVRNTEIVIAAADGSSIEPLFKRAEDQWVFAEAWASDGAKAVLEFSDHGNAYSAELYELDIPTRAVRRLTNDGLWTTRARYAQDGSGDIIFATEEPRGSGQENFYRSRNDGTWLYPGDVRLNLNSVRNGEWPNDFRHADGKLLHGCGNDICLLDAGTGNTTILIANAAVPAWGPKPPEQCLPVAVDAGSDGTYYENDNVSLTGKVIDACNRPVTTWWEKVGDPTRHYGNSYIFAAPQVGRDGLTLGYIFSAEIDGQTVASDTVNVKVVNMNHPPVSVPVAEPAVAEGSLVALNGCNSYDPDDDALAFRWESLEGLAINNPDQCNASFIAPPVGRNDANYHFTLTVDDGIDVDAKSIGILDENVNHAPVAEAGDNFAKMEGQTATLNGSASSDPDNDPLTYLWTAPPGVVLSEPTSGTPTFIIPEFVRNGGNLIFSLVVNDGLADSALDTVAVTVLSSNTPPNCTNAQAQPQLLWPPNHKLVPVSIQGVTDKEDPTVTISVTGVSQNEPTNGLGDGDTPIDAFIQPEGGLLLRAERSGTGTGRIYRIDFVATDSRGDQCAGKVQLVVPQSIKKTVPDNGEAWYPSDK